ncbi:MAG TPA: glutamate racemase, partial [Psychromonas hadalis]|nr:glutamate racemase [Psychromonas hadalis]
MSLKQVLIFDSGVGGLSICKEIVDLGIVADCNYLFDNAYFPYGELTDKALITRLTQLLSDFASQHPTDLIVIACNSASTVALQTLRTHFDIPI